MFEAFERELEDEMDSIKILNFNSMNRVEIVNARRIEMILALHSKLKL